MGVEHYVVCNQCKEYIDMHKAYAFSSVINKERPPVGIDCKESSFNDVVLKGGYWESRGLWFVWQHRGHVGIECWTDFDDDWFNLKPQLKEVFLHDEDLKIRKKVDGE